MPTDKELTIIVDSATGSLIDEALATGRFKSLDEFVASAVSAWHAERSVEGFDRAWLAEKLEEGLAGDVVDGPAAMRALSRQLAVRASER